MLYLLLVHMSGKKESHALQILQAEDMQLLWLWLSVCILVLQFLDAFLVLRLHSHLNAIALYECTHYEEEMNAPKIRKQSGKIP